jgi:hypothetical protein
MRHLRRLFEAFPWHRLVPEQVDADWSRVQHATRLHRPPRASPTLVARGSGEGDLRVQAAVAEDGSYAVAYLPEALRLTIDLGRLKGLPISASWFDPTGGEYRFHQRFTSNGKVSLRAPSTPDERDRVLVLRVEDADAGR